MTARRLALPKTARPAPPKHPSIDGVMRSLRTDPALAELHQELLRRFGGDRSVRYIGRWLTAENLHLEWKTPLAALIAGNIADVLRAAQQNP